MVDLVETALAETGKVASTGIEKAVSTVIGKEASDLGTGKEALNLETGKAVSNLGTGKAVSTGTGKESLVAVTVSSLNPRSEVDLVWEVASKLPVIAFCPRGGIISQYRRPAQTFASTSR